MTSTNPRTITEAEQRTREQLGADFTVAKVSRYWIPMRKDSAGSYKSLFPQPHRPGDSPIQSTSFDKAIAMAQAFVAAEAE
jgi:hypothetical protein